MELFIYYVIEVKMIIFPWNLLECTEKNMAENCQC